MLPNPQIKEVTLQDYLKVVKKKIGVTVAFLIIIPCAVTIFVFTTKPVYRASVSILIEKSQPKITKFEDVYQTSYQDNQYYQTQYKILESRGLAERVFEEMHLSRDPDYAEAKDPIQKLQDQISIEPIKNSQIVLVNVEDPDALRASSIANTLAKVYIQQDIQMRNRATKEATGWLESQLTDIKKKMRDSEEALNKYLQENKIVTIPDVEKKSQTLLDELKQNKSRLETDIAEAAKRYKEKHPKMIALRAQLDDVNKKIEQETDHLLDLNQKLVQYNMLKKDVESNQQLYTAMLTRSKETDVSEKLIISSIRVIDSAKPPEVPFKPKKLRDILMSIALSLFAGVGFSFFLEYLDSSIRTAEDVSLYLDMPFLGYIPSISREVKTEAERSLICYAKPSSKVTESYRAIRTSILFASPEDKPLKNILITSSIPQEGKSFIASNLSEVFCQVNERVVLLDVDMRRPRLHKNFDLEQKNGLSDFLTGNVDSQAIIKSTGVKNLSVITAGTIPPNPSELLSSAKVLSLFEELKSKFERIILDSPPALSAADTSLLANIVDGIVLVVKGGRTRRESILQAKERILKARGKIIGVVINNINLEKEDSYYYYHYYSEESQKQKK